VSKKRQRETRPPFGNLISYSRVRVLRARAYIESHALFFRERIARAFASIASHRIECFSRSVADASYARKIRVFCIFRLAAAACFDLEPNNIKTSWRLDRITRRILFRPHASTDSTSRFDVIERRCGGKTRDGSLAVTSDGKWNRTKLSL
jgi:hypothetical protein